uniref:CC2D2A N-terminal C2 domain-containing protein n=2 Tax=Octactis speculum TaxID=3111310 RepID=A0A7S2BIU1_9STRA
MTQLSRLRLMVGRQHPSDELLHKLVLDEIPVSQDRAQVLQNLRRVYFYVVIRANGQELARTKPSSLVPPLMTVHFQDPLLRLTLIHRPRLIEAQVWMRRTGGGYLNALPKLRKDELVASVPVPLPGDGASLDGQIAQSLSDSIAWHSFACSKSMTRDDLRHTHGRVLITTRWGQQANEAVLLPKTAHDPNESHRVQGKLAVHLKQPTRSTGARLKKSTHPDSSNSNINSNSNSNINNLDPNDPRCCHSIRLDSHERELADRLQGPSRFHTSMHVHQLGISVPVYLTGDHNPSNTTRPKRWGVPPSIATKANPNREWHLLSNPQIFDQSLRHRLLTSRDKEPE